jgi:6-pyruvoyltetrahydropterin/6-carboxytetrahydropterin synthase
MYTAALQFRFSASHRLTGLPPHHPDGRDHGHNYVVEVRLVSREVDSAGLVADARRLAGLERYISEHLDRRCLNDVLQGQPSSELIARHLYEWCKTHWEPGLAERLHQVRVWDSLTSWAAYGSADGSGLSCAGSYTPVVKDDIDHAGPHASRTRTNSL